MALARVWQATMTSGVPVGAQIAWLSWHSSGCPFDVTRVAELVNCAVMHGPFAAGGGGSAQPAIIHGPDNATVGWPLTSTRGLGTIACAWPAWVQITVAPTCSRNPGIVHSS
jgi:hypothetical protein